MSNEPSAATPNDIWVPSGAVMTVKDWEEKLNATDENLIDFDDEKPIQKMPISFLQELCAKRRSTPIYEMLASEGQVHEPTFLYRVIIDDITGIGSGKSKKLAKHNAAKAALERIVDNDRYKEWLIPGENRQEAIAYLHSIIPEIGAQPDPTNESNVAELEAAADQASNEEPEGGAGNVVGKLQETCAKKRWPFPIYDLVEESGMPHDKTFVVKASVGNFEQTGTARSKKTAKRIASELLLKQLLALPQNLSDELMVEDDNPDDENDPNAAAPDSILDDELSTYANEHLSTTNNHAISNGQAADHDGTLVHPENRTPEDSNKQPSSLNELSKTDFGVEEKPLAKHKEMLYDIGQAKGWNVFYTHLDRKSKDGKRQCLVSFGDNSVCHGTGDTLEEAEWAAAFNALDLVKMLQNHS